MYKMVRIPLLWMLIIGGLIGETLQLDLNTARNIALENNPTVKLAREGVRKARSGITEARGNLLPTVSAFSKLQHAWELATMVVDNPFYDPVTNPRKKMYFKMGSENIITSGIDINQAVYTGGAIWNGFQISKIGYQIAESQLKSTEQKLLSEVTSAYYGVLFAQSTVAVSREALTSAEENYEQVKKFYNSGKSSRFDLLRAEVQMENLKPAVVSSENNYRLAESRLRMTLGIDDHQEIIFSEKLEYTPSEYTNMTLEELIELAFQNRPEVKMINDQQEIAKRQVTLAKAAMSPSIMLGTAYQYQGQRDDFQFTNDDFFKSFNSSISISIPLFNGMQNKSKVQQAKISLKESKHREESLLNGIVLEVKGAYFTMKEAEEKVFTQQRTIEQAREALRLAKLMYSEGGSTQLDVINANLALNQARMNYQQSLFEYNVALANLKKAINQL